MPKNRKMPLLQKSDLDLDKKTITIIGLAREVVRLSDAFEEAKNLEILDTAKMDSSMVEVQAKLLQAGRKIIKKRLEYELGNLIKWCKEA